MDQRRADGARRDPLVRAGVDHDAAVRHVATLRALGASFVKLTASSVIVAFGGAQVLEAGAQTAPLGIAEDAEDDDELAYHSADG